METNEICTLRHKTASGRASNYWEFLPNGGFPLQPACIFISVRLGSAVAVECDVPVCTNRSTLDANASQGARIVAYREHLAGRWVLVRKGESTFILTAAKMPMDVNSIARSERFHEDLPVGSLVLTDAPPEIAAEIASL